MQYLHISVSNNKPLALQWFRELESSLQLAFDNFLNQIQNNRSFASEEHCFYIKHDKTNTITSLYFHNRRREKDLTL